MGFNAFLFFIIHLFLLPYAVPVGASTLEPSIAFETETLPATGQKETRLKVSAFGRYALMVKSPQGSAIQLVDRLAGPGAIHGVAGQADGRVDDFLEKGEYQLIVRSHQDGKGVLQLTAHPFKELNAPQPPKLMRLKQVETQLRDFEQRSYWIEIKKRRQVAIEAAGRSLSDLRLWQSGDWLIDRPPQKSVLEPHAGQPLNALQIVADLNPGLYLLTAYGGPSQAWATASQTRNPKQLNDQPLYIRMGIPKLPAAGRQTLKASPFGIDRFRIPAQANFYQLTLPKAEAAVLNVHAYQKNNPFYAHGTQTSLTPKSRLPVAEVTTYSQENNDNLVTVQREAGKTYTLQFFKSVRQYHFNGSGRYWIRTLHSGHGEDDIDATALLIEYPPNQKGHLIAKQAISIGPASPWRRKFNLLKPLTFLIEIGTQGSYFLEGQGADARFRVEPFFIHPPRNYQKPADKRSGAAWGLDPGVYVVTITPEKHDQGVFDLVIRHAAEQRTLKALTPAQPLIATRFKNVRLHSKSAYTLYLNEQPGVQTGVILRKFPINLNTPLPITQKPEETLDLEVRLPEKGRLAAVTEEGRTLTIWHSGRMLDERQLQAGTYTITIKNSEQHFIHYHLTFTPERLLAPPPFPPFRPRRSADCPNSRC